MAHSVRLNLLYSTTASRPRSSSSSSNAITLFSPFPSLSLLTSPPSFLASPKLPLRTSHFSSIKSSSTTIAEPGGIKVSINLFIYMYIMNVFLFAFWLLDIWVFFICVCVCVCRLIRYQRSRSKGKRLERVDSGRRFALIVNSAICVWLLKYL